MSRFTPISLERVDRNDPTLTADGLSEFLPANAPDSDPMLAVSTLGDLFPARETDEIGDYFTDGNEAFIDRNEASRNDEPAETSLDDDEVFGAAQTFELEGLFESHEVVASDIQRAAMEFQRFAEKFHAFAIENQQR